MMKVRPTIDPRTGPCPEYGPIHEYRVVFCQRGRANENDTSGADDVHQVIEWADAGPANARGPGRIAAKTPV
jgi:hypothetical protein